MGLFAIALVVVVLAGLVLALAWLADRGDRPHRDHSSSDGSWDTVGAGPSVGQDAFTHHAHHHHGGPHDHGGVEHDGSGGSHPHDGGSFDSGGSDGGGGGDGGGGDGGGGDGGGGGGGD